MRPPAPARDPFPAPPTPVQAPHRPPPPPPPPPIPLPPEFSGTRFHFTAGVGPGERARVLDDEGTALLTYRGFASVIGIVAGLVAAIVMAAGIAAAFFLFVEKSTLSSIGALALSLFFALIVVLLIPAAHVTLMAGDRAMLKIIPARGGFPSSRWTIATPDGQVIGMLRKGAFARFGRSRWKIADAKGKTIGHAGDESLFRAYLRKVAGKFDREFEADVLVTIGKTHAATIFRRPDEHDSVDVLEIHAPAIDHRIAVALATLVFGSEP